MQAGSILAPLRSFAWMEWVFVGLAWLTLTYFFFNLLDHVDGGAPLDLMPVLAGAGAIPALWWAFRIGHRVEKAVERLSEGAGVTVRSNETWSAFRADFRRTMQTWTRRTAISIAIIMVPIFFSIAHSQGFDWTFDADTWKQIVLGMVMPGTGLLIGSTLGRLIGYGHLGQVMERHNIRIVSLATPAAREAMRSLEGVFWFAVFTSMALCHWFAAWWIVWHFGLDTTTTGRSLDLPDYRSLYQWSFLGLWLVSLTIFVFAARLPVRSFHRRLDAIYGGAGARDALEQQLKEAGEDLRALDPGNPRVGDERRGLETFIIDLEARRFRSPLLNPTLMDALIGWNVILIVVPLLLGTRIPFAF
ncbi:hypothetical protein [Bradyrhizobium sp. HKCCYLRH1062]|uniref:hypothetical protein n=1 Tax=unclassified Bradyrhizobium TaxID=2631580 RepID=UPI003EBCFA18